MYISPISANQTVQAVSSSAQDQFTAHPDAAQYKNAGWGHVARVERGISLDQAFEIAANDDNIAYFMYVKGHTMVLEIDLREAPASTFDEDQFGLVLRGGYYDENKGRTSYGIMRVFHEGDVVFFWGPQHKWLGSAPGLADTYEKIVQAPEAYNKKS